MPFHVGEPLLLLHVARSCDGPGSLYDAVRFAWRLNVERARPPGAGAHGGAAGGGGFGPYEVVGAFRPRRWLPATPANFPELPEPPPGRGVLGQGGDEARLVSSGLRPKASARPGASALGRRAGP